MRFLRVLLVLIVLATCLCVGAYFIFRQSFPPSKIQELLVTALEKALRRPISVEMLSVNPLRGFTVKNVKVYQLPNERSPFFSVKKMEFRYNWKSLLSKQLEVTELILHSPEITVERSGNLLSDRVEETDSVNTTFRIPFALNIQKITIEQATIRFLSQSDSSTFFLQIPTISISVRNFSLDSLNNSKSFFPEKLDCRLQIDQAPLTVQFRNSSSRKAQSSFQPEAGKIRVPCTLLLNAGAEAASRSSQEELPFNYFIRVETGIADFAIKDSVAKNQTVVTPPMSISGSGNLALDLSFVQVTGKLNVGDWGTAIASIHRNFDTSSGWNVTVDSLELFLDRFAAFTRHSGIEEVFSFPTEQLKGKVVARGISVLRTSGGSLSYAAQCFLSEVSFYETGMGISSKGLAGNCLIQKRLNGATILEATLRCDSLTGIPGADFLGTLSNSKLHLSALLDSTLFPDSLQVRIEMADLWGGELLGELLWDNRSAKGSKEFDFSALKTSAIITASGIDLSRIFSDEINGEADLFLELSSNQAPEGRISLGASTYDLSVEFDSTEGLEIIPNVQVSLDGKWSIDSLGKVIQLTDVAFNVNRLINGRFEAQFNPQKSVGSVYSKEVNINLPLLIDFFPGYLRDEMINARWQGQIQLTNEITFWQDSSGEWTTQVIGDMMVENEYFENLLWYVSLDTLTMYGTYAGGLNTIEADFDGSVAQFQLLETTSLLTDGEIGGTVLLDDWQRLSLRPFYVHFPKQETDLSVEGSIDFGKQRTEYSLFGEFSVQPDTTSKLLLFADLSGIADSRFSLLSDPVNPDILILQGVLKLQNVSLEKEGEWRISGIQGTIPFHQPVDLISWYFLPVPVTETEWWYFRQSDPFSGDAAGLGKLLSSLSMDTLSFLQYHSKNVRVALRYHDGHIMVPWFKTELYDGNLFGSAFINLNSGALEDIDYQISAQLSRVNSAILPGIRPDEQTVSRIGVTVHLNGTGIDLHRKVDLDGQIRVTQIDKKSLSYFLQSLDPDQKDPGIRSVQRFLNLGFRPTKLAFLLQHGNVYPSIILKQPWFSPVRIAGNKIALSRVPIQMILDWIAMGS